MSKFALKHRSTDNSAIPTIIFAMLVANGLLFAAQQLQLEFMLYNFALWPVGSLRPEFHVWQLLSYGFLHGNLNHIFFNMFGLWMFGRDLERMMGPRRFLIYYLTCIIGAGIVQVIVSGTQGGIYPTVGASGGVFGVLLAFALAFPNRVIVMLFPPIPMKAKYFVLLYGLLELYLGLSGRAPGIANFAHLGGMLFGFLLIQYWRNARSQ